MRAIRRVDEEGELSAIGEKETNNKENWERDFIFIRAGFGCWNGNADLFDRVVFTTTSRVRSYKTVVVHLVL